MTELHCVNTHTAQADRAVAAALPPAQQLSSTIVAPHPLTLYVLSPLPYPSARELLPAGQTRVWTSLPVLNLLQNSGKRSLPVPDVSRAAWSQPCRWEWKMWCDVLHVAQTHELTVLLKMSKEEGGDKDCNFMFSKYSTAFDIQGLHLVQLMLGILKPYWNIYYFYQCCNFAIKSPPIFILYFSAFTIHVKCRISEKHGTGEQVLLHANKISCATET